MALPAFLKAPGVKSGLVASLDYLYGENPFSAASEYLDKMPDALKYYDSFIENANNQYPVLNKYSTGGYDQFSRAGDIYQKMSNPNFQNLLGLYYRKSPGYDFAKHEGLDAIGRASAASGMSGTPSDQYKQGEWATHFADEDYNKFMDRLYNNIMQSAMGQSRLAELGGNIGSNVYGLGQKSADERATSEMNMYKTQAGNAAYGAGYDNSGLGNIVSTALSFLGI